MAATIAYNNLFTDSSATVTASSAATNFDAANAYDWWLYDAWKPSATGPATFEVSFASNQACDYFGIVGHTLGTDGHPYSFEYWDGSAWQVVQAATPSNDNIIFGVFTQQNRTKYRFNFNVPAGQTLGQIAQLMCGARLDLPYGMQPGFPIPNMTYNYNVQNQESIGGLLLGSTLIAKGEKFEIAQPGVLDPTYVRSTLKPFLDHAIEKPFLFCWDTTNYINETVYAHIDGPPPPPTHESGLHMTFKLPCVGVTK